MQWLVLIICFTLLVDNVSATEKNLDAAQIKNSPINLKEYFSVLEDSSLKLTLEDVRRPENSKRFKIVSASSDTLNFGFSTSSYWLHFVLRNQYDYPIERMIEIGYSRLSHVRLHQPIKDGGYLSVITGNDLPFMTRPYKNRNFVFPIYVPANGNYDYYLEIKSTSPILIPVQIWTPDAFHTHERNDYFNQALYFGMAIGMMLFNLLLFFALKEIIYLWYSIFITCFSIFLAADKGLANEFLWMDSPNWSRISAGVGMSLSLATFLIFMRQMLSTRTIIPNLDKLIKFLIGINFFIPVGFAFAFQSFIQPSVLFYLSTMLLILCIGIFCVFKRQRSAYLFVAAYSMLVIAVAMNSLTGLGILPTNGLTVNALPFGSALEMILLAFALADRFNIIRQEKVEAQKQALAAQEHLLENLKSSERVLEERVEERTLALLESNQALSNANLELEDRKIELERLSVTDRLTGLYNRLMLDRVLEEVINRQKMYAYDFALLLLDVDKFKSTNDSYGHLVGDKVLIELAQILAERARSVDVVGRWGGEEFLIICRDTDVEAAVLIAEKMRQSIEQFNFSVVGNKTASFGVTAVRRNDTISQMMTRIDKALYRAKELGRNRVEYEV